MSAPFLTAIPYHCDSSLYFERLRHLPYPVWLDSCAHQPGLEGGRYDILSAKPEELIEYRQGQCRHTVDDGSTRLESLPPMLLLAQRLARYQQVACELPFCGGALGLFGYELKAQFEPTRCPNTRHHDEAEMRVGIYLWGLVQDHQRRQSQLVFHPEAPPRFREQIQALVLEGGAATASPPGRFQLLTPFQCDTSAEGYRVSFERIQHYIRAGDCYQINYTQRFSSRYQGDPLTAYLKLRQTSPAPFSAYLETPEGAVLSHSPERFIECRGRRVESKPIKGTAVRGATPEEDRQNARQLLESDKDRAENLMIVDLLRNDLGRDCRPGSIKVPRLFALESYANVHHLVSTVTGTLGYDRTALDLFTHAFPGGSITGAPKIRAMEIIDELEDQSRSIYCGSIAYLSFNRRMDSSICIRTLLAHRGELHCWGGGGIVADSEYEAEREESFAKVRNLVRALEGYLPDGTVAPEERDL
ncbi:aminodeoxychorismate synthase component I [Aestuariirhabdus litorea]|uniref:aminodeoxychorismate synthase n=1 Tax=Aestuariirhabdus litorea TaxID=2528527 RepID=A0A3P3VRC7_9GAMM|nr:aminodeoxychorismate synthase component I [Aestuariirhabdus litorea]RRJ84867.1 aminodeoxychorismate synthase component I [Aestuariirhabdus litorea]RWW98093.1 aminodeoxychorismate synthase component I [Endozoicomonadaceae bacterium GTF-13]